MVIIPTPSTSQGNESAFVHQKGRVVTGRVGKGRDVGALRIFKQWGNSLTALRNKLGEKEAEDLRACPVLLRKTKIKKQNEAV